MPPPQKKKEEERPCSTMSHVGFKIESHGGRCVCVCVCVCVRGGGIGGRNSQFTERESIINQQVSFRIP